MSLHDILNSRNDGSPDYTQRQVQDAIGMFVGRVSSDVTTTSQSLQPVNDLSFPVLANETFYFRALIYTGSSTTTGVKIGVTFPAGATVKGNIFGTTTGLNVFNSEPIPTSGTASTNAYNTVVSQTGWIEVEGLIRNGNTDGTFLIKGLKVTSGTATILTDSGFIAQKMN